MRREAESARELYIRMQDKLEEAGMAAGAHGTDITVVDEARPPAKAAWPNVPLFLAVGLFAGLWIAVGSALLLESMQPSRAGALLIVAGIHAGCRTVAWTGAHSEHFRIAHGGSALARKPAKTSPLRIAKEAPAAWTGVAASGLPGGAANLSAAPMAAPIAPGDVLDVAEYHTPEFHSVVRVSASRHGQTSPAG